MYPLGEFNRQRRAAKHAKQIFTTPFLFYSLHFLEFILIPFQRPFFLDPVSLGFLSFSWEWPDEIQKFLFLFYAESNKLSDHLSQPKRVVKVFPKKIIKKNKSKKKASVLCFHLSISSIKSKKL